MQNILSDLSLDINNLKKTHYLFEILYSAHKQYCAG